MSTAGTGVGVGVGAGIEVATGPVTREFAGADGIRLVGDEWAPTAGDAVVLLHGGGQTRHSWKRAGGQLAARGFHVLTLDNRGHGDSDWAARGGYSLEHSRDDVLAVLTELAVPVIVVGASMGGMTGLLVAQAAGPERVRGLALVDIVPHYEKIGSARIRDFMLGAPAGFGSLDEAAAAVAAYLPHRPKPSSAEGLKRNLRLGEDGRWRWHWDPAMMQGVGEQAQERTALLEDAARSLTVPTLLVRGELSDVVSDEGVANFRVLVPAARIVTLAGTAHTAAGDDNNAFTRVVTDFCVETWDAQE